MSNIDPVTISVVLALCAILSPIIVAVINNLFQLRMKRLDRELDLAESHVLHQRTVFELYLRSAERCIANNPSPACVDQYRKHYLLALMYAPDDLQKEMRLIHQDAVRNNWGNVSSPLERLAPALRDHIAASLPDDARKLYRRGSLTKSA